MKLCECGCGAPAPIAKRTRPESGHRKGKPVRFVRGHHARVANSLPHPSGAEHPNFKGRVRHGPYWVVRVGADHPMASARGYVYEHRLVMAEHLGRMLEPDEVVHHADGDTEHNAIENLQLFASQADHARYHELERPIRETSA